MKKESLLAIMALLIAPTSYSHPNNSPNNLTVNNLTEGNIYFWVNGESYSIDRDSAISIPCFRKEQMQFEINEEIQLLDCGVAVEVSNEG